MHTYLKPPEKTLDLVPCGLLRHALARLDDDVLGLRPRQKAVLGESVGRGPVVTCTRLDSVGLVSV
jgi:hypothetical protein